MTKLADHISSWTLLGVMLAAGLAWSVWISPPFPVSGAAGGLDGAGPPTAPGGYEVRRGHAGARLGFERHEDREPSWYD